MNTNSKHRVRKPVTFDTLRGLGRAAGIALAGALLMSPARLGAQSLPSIPVLLPVYEIETISNGRTSSLLNLPLGQPGIIQVPRPVDVDGDLVPDIMVAVNLVNLPGALQNPPTLGNIIAPNIEIMRAPLAVTLGKPSPPVKVQIKLTVTDLNHQIPDTVVRFGYDTGRDGALPLYGTIPQSFRAIVRGLDTFFNPLSAEITSANPISLGNAANGYEGPLDLVASIGTSPGLAASSNFSLQHVLGLLANPGSLLNPPVDVNTDLRFGYRPFPGDLSVVYSSDNAGSHVTYSHAAQGEIDLDTRVALYDRQSATIGSTVLAARVDRLPKQVHLDFNTDNHGGVVNYHAPSSGRAPDVHVSVVSEKLNVMTSSTPTSASLQASLSARLAGARLSGNIGAYLGLGEVQNTVVLGPAEPPLIAQVDIDALPSAMSAQWSFPAQGPVSALFCAGTVSGTSCTPSGQGIGAIEADVRNYYGAPLKLLPLLPEQQQIAAFQTAKGGTLGDEQRIHGRVERIRQLAFNQSADGFNATAQAGDGELPLELRYDSDDRTSTTGNRISAKATIAPLPDLITASLAEPGDDQKAKPLQLVYAASKSIDIDTRVELRNATAGPDCGQRGTICGNLKLRHLPAQITARIGSFNAPSDLATDRLFAESRIEIDAVPRAGGAKPDFFADLLLGQDDATPTVFTDDVPLVAHAELLGFPAYTRVRTREGLSHTLDRVEFHACKELFDQPVPACEAGSEGQIGAITFNVRNWLARPTGLPIFNPVTPLYATLAARGEDAAGSPIRFEATGKVTDIARLVYRNTNRIFGVSSQIGGGKNFSTLVDLGNIDVAGADPANGRLDLPGNVQITPLPATLDFCVRSSGEAPQTLSDSFTDPCENANPFAAFGDVGPVARSPMSIAYRAASQFDVMTSINVTQRGLDPGPGDDQHFKGVLNVQHLPSAITAHFEAPKQGETGPLRAVYEAAAGPGRRDRHR